MATSPEEQSPAGSGRRLAEQNIPGLFTILWRRRRVFVLSLSLVLAGCVTYLLTARPRYTSTARVYLRDGGATLFAADQRISEPRGESYLHAQAQFLLSAPILSNALQTPAVAAMEWLQECDDPIDMLKERLQVTLGRKDSIISVSFISSDPAEAATLVNAVVDAYVQYNKSLHHMAATELVDVLRQEKASRELELETKSRALYEYKLANDTLSFASDQGNVIIQRLARLSDALTEAELQAVAAKSTYEAAQAVGLSPQKMRRLIELQHIEGGSKMVGEDEQAIRADLARMTAQHAIYSRKYGKGHPTLHAMETALAQMRQRVEQADRQFCESYVAATHATWETAQRQAEAIREQMERQQQQAMLLNAKSAEYARLESERARVERLCDALDARLKELNLTQKVGAADIHVLEQGRVAVSPTTPKKGRTMALGLVLGSMLGVGLSLLQELRDERMHSADDVYDAVQLPLLAAIPHLSGRLTAMQKAQTVHLRPKSDEAEAFRKLRTALHFGSNRRKPRTMLVTSPAAGEGKSTTASNLAIALAHAGCRVLLLEADLRKPVLHVLFGLDPHLGLWNVLARELSAAQAIRPSGIVNLDVLTAGPIPNNPSEILGSQLFSSLLSRLGRHYDHVVIDSPPVGAVTDAQILSAMTDQTILVLRARTCSRHAASYASQSLQSVGGRVRGVVVNDIQHGPYATMTYGYGGYRSAQLTVESSGSALAVWPSGDSPSSSDNPTGPQKDGPPM